MSDQPTTSTEPSPGGTGARRPYVTPVLRVFGTVAAMTESVNKTGSVKDGGSNDVKT